MLHAKHTQEKKLLTLQNRLSFYLLHAVYMNKIPHSALRSPHYTVSIYVYIYIYIYIYKWMYVYVYVPA
jgi:hypothetical protein